MDHERRASLAKIADQTIITDKLHSGQLHSCQLHSSERLYYTNFTFRGVDFANLCESEPNSWQVPSYGLLFKRAYLLHGHGTAIAIMDY